MTLATTNPPNAPMGRSLILAVALLGTLAPGGPARAQATFDPYRPESSAYNAYVFPSQPNNLALPNAAREANDYANGSVFRGSRYNTFDRYLNGEGGGSLGSGLAPRRATGAGVPYYDAYRQLDRDFQRDYIPNREADRAFSIREAERNRRYAAAMRERDPAKRAQLLRKVNDPVDVRSSEEDLDREPVATARKPAVGASTAPSTRSVRPRSSAISPSTRPRPRSTAPADPLAEEALRATAPGADPVRPSSSGYSESSRTREMMRTRDAVTPGARPSLPSEILDRNRRSTLAPGGSAPPPPVSGPAPLDPTSPR